MIFPFEVFFISNQRYPLGFILKRKTQFLAPTAWHPLVAGFAARDTANGGRNREGEDKAFASKKNPV
jgi:hypothetical protein